MEPEYLALARWPASDSARSVTDVATIIPSTDSGVSEATQPDCPSNATSPAGNGTGDVDDRADYLNLHDHCHW
jgi:hypothetical protein